MPATITTKEIFPSDTKVSKLDAEIKLRIKAGAVRSRREKKPEGWVIFTEWNVIGQND